MPHSVLANVHRVRSFVVRAGRITESQKKALQDFWPKYGLEVADGPLTAAFPNPAPLVLEIGYGMGDSLIRMAEQHSEYNVVGVEVHPPGVGRLVNEIAKRNLPNLKTYQADATDVLDRCIPEGTLARVQVYFPDPWPKKRHHKRRLIRPDFVDKMARRLAVGGELHLCTDWVPYADHMLEVLNASQLLENTSPTNSYSEKPAWRPLTKFEQRGQRLGHEVRDLVYRRVQGDASESDQHHCVTLASP